MLFVLLHAPGCAPTSPPSPDSPLLSELIVGFPEEIGETGDRGIEEFVRMLSEEGLTSARLDGRPDGALAETWSWEAENLQLRVRLKPGISLQDGTAFTGTLAAEIVRRTIANPKNLVQYPALSDIASVEPHGDLELVFTLERASALLPEDLAVPLDSGKGTTALGPYRLIERTSSGAVLERFENYYLGPPPIQRILVQPSGRLRASWTRLLRGDVAMVTNVPADAVQFVRNEDVQVLTYPRWYQFAILLNSKRQALKQPSVRRALNGAVDREEVIANALHGQGTPSTGPIWPHYWAYDESIAGFTYDPVLASSVLDAAGFTQMRSWVDSSRPPARVRFTCLVMEDFSVQERIAMVVQKHLTSIGVDMEIEIVSSDEMEQRTIAGNFDAILLDMISGPTPGRAYMFWASASRFRGLNMFGYENPEAERQFSTIRTTLNEIKVRSATSRLQRTLLDDPPAIFLAWNERSRALRRTIVIPDTEGDPMGTIAQWQVRGDERTTPR